MTDEQLMAEVQEAKEHLEQLGYTVAYIGIYWSQNYGLAEYSEEYQSDIDLKAVIVPSLDDLVYNSKPKSTTLDFKGGQIDLKDIRIFMETIVKCNPAYIETLYTPYCIYTEEYKPIINERENLVSEMWEFLLKACYGMIMEKVKAFSHPYPNIADKIEKFGYDPKQLHHIIRLAILMGRFVGEWKFNMTPFVPDFLMMVKKGKFNLNSASSLRDWFQEQALEYKEEYKVESKFNSKERILQYSRDLVKKSIVDSIKKKKLKPCETDYCPICAKSTASKKVNDHWGQYIECQKCFTQFSHLPNM